MGKRQASSVEPGEIVSTDVPSWPPLLTKLGSTIFNPFLWAVASMLSALRTATDFFLDEKIQCVTVSRSYPTGNTKEKNAIVSRALEKLKLPSCFQLPELHTAVAAYRTRRSGTSTNIIWFTPARVTQESLPWRSDSAVPNWKSPSCMTTLLYKFGDFRSITCPDLGLDAPCTLNENEQQPFKSIRAKLVQMAEALSTRGTKYNGMTEVMTCDLDDIFVIGERAMDKEFLDKLCDATS